MTFVDWIDRHRTSLLFVAFVLGLGGLYAAATLPVGLFPVTSFPRIRIEVNVGSMPAKQMLVNVTRPLEEAARAIPGATEVTSTTSRGSAEIYVSFPWHSNMNQALLRVDAAMARKLPDLPPSTRYHAIQMSPNAIMPFVSYSLESNQISPEALRRLAKYQIVPLLTGIPGVKRVGVLGGKTPEVQVTINPARLQAHGITLAAVAKAIANTNKIAAVGRLEDNDLLYLTVANNSFDSLKSVNNVRLHTAQGGIVRLGDLAQVTMGSVPKWLLVYNNGHPAVNFNVYQQDSASSLTLVKEVQKRLDAFMQTQPKSIQLHKWYDQTKLVSSSISSLVEAILIGLVFAALVMLFALRNWRATLVAVLVVPLSVLISVLLLSMLGLTFNIMTLGGIAAVIGLLIDDVIVMIEHIARRAGAPRLKKASSSVLLAAREFLAPLLGSSLATVIIFVPLAFLSGITGAFFQFLSLTVASALIISFILTLFTVPLLARSIIDFNKWEDPGHGGDSRLQRAHGRLLGLLFARPWLLLIGLGLLLAAGYAAYKNVGSGFLPRMDEGGFVLDYQSAPGTSLAETNRELQQVADILRQDPAVDTFSRRTGAGLGGGLSESYQGDFFVRLVPPGKRPSIWQVMDRISTQITSQVPGISFDTHQLLGDMIGDMVGHRQPVVITLQAKNPDILDKVARKVAAAIRSAPGVQPSSVNDGVIPAGDALEIHVKPAAAAMLGLTATDVEGQVNHYLHGAVVTRYLGSEQEIGVRLRLAAPHQRLDRDTLGKLPIRSPKGQLVPLDSIAQVTFVAGQPQLTRENLQQVVTVTAGMTGTQALSSTITAVKKILAKPGLLPSGVSYTLGGAYKQQQKAVNGMVKVFAAALLAEVVLLLFLYERLWIPVIILGSSILSTGAVFIGLWLTGVQLNITAMMGMVMIVGITTEMAIFLVSEYQALEADMPPHQALQQAALNRLRPITMSTLAMILALLPIGAAISGSGDQMLQPLAIAIIAGAVAQLPLALLAMPVLIGLTVRRQNREATA